MVAPSTFTSTEEKPFFIAAIFSGKGLCWRSLFFFSLSVREILRCQIRQVLLTWPLGHFRCCAPGLPLRLGPPGVSIPFYDFVRRQRSPSIAGIPLVCYSPLARAPTLVTPSGVPLPSHGTGRGGVGGQSDTCRIWQRPRPHDRTQRADAATWLKLLRQHAAQPTLRSREYRPSAGLPATRRRGVVT